MKWKGLIMMAVLLQVFLEGGAQTVSISGKDLPLKEIFSTINKQTGVSFFYDATLVQEIRPMTIELKNVSLETALNGIFEDRPLTWVLEDKIITIIRRPKQSPGTGLTVPRAPLPIQVKGSVVDIEGAAIEGVSVLVKGTNQGTVSNESGLFSIAASNKNILIFSSVNYNTKELKVADEKMIITLTLVEKPMESFMVGGNFTAVKRKADATSVTTINSKNLEQIPVNTLEHIFRGWVPGTNSFEVGGEPEGFPTLSIRGANSSNSLSTIAVYINGIEYAGGSGYLSQLDKNNIDRIEIVRGPGAATLYGTGSNGGIVNIFTKEGKPNQSIVNFTSSAGYIKSKWVEKNPFQQMHHLETVTDFKKVVLTLGGSYRTAGAYKPGGGEKNRTFYTGIDVTLGKLQVQLTARYAIRNFGFAKNPLFDTAVNPRTDIIIEPSLGSKTPAYVWFNVQPRPARNKNGITETYLTTMNLSFRPKKNWVNNLDVGYTANISSEVPLHNGTTPLQTRYLSSNLNITTIRYSNVINLSKSTNNLAATLTSGAEFKNYSTENLIVTAATVAGTFTHKQPDNKNYGAFVQLNPSYKNVYLTMGLRYEKNELFKPAWNPRIGLTTNFVLRSLTIKPRMSWGKGISSPSYENRFGQPANGITVVYENPDIKPQSQQGFDYGLEVYDKKGQFRFEASYYDNILKDMITQKAVGPASWDPNIAGFIYTNVGKVSNRGWEFLGEYQTKRISVHGTFSVINTTIKDSTGSYILTQLKLAPGTRLVNLPKHTAGLYLTYYFSRLFGKTDKGAVSLNITEMDGLKTLDYVNYALDVSYGRIAYQPGVFGYAVENPPLFRMGIYADYYLFDNFRLFTQGSNILNNYQWEYSSQITTYGASWLFGIKYNFKQEKSD